MQNTSWCPGLRAGGQPLCKARRIPGPRLDGRGDM